MNTSTRLRLSAALCAAVAAIGLWGSPRAACADDKPALTAEDAGALVALIRARAAAQPAAEPALPGKLRAPSQLPLIATLYGAGRPLQRWALGANLGEAAEKVGDELGRALADRPDHERALQAGVLQLDVVVARKTLAQKDRRLFLREFDPGIQGLACILGARTVYLTPVALLASWGTLEVVRSADVVKAAFLAQEDDETLPPFDSAEQLLTLCFVEKKPGGAVAPVCRGNVLRDPPHAEDIAEAALRAGLWFLRTQQQDGSFLKDYFPADQASEKSYRLVDHLRATVAITLLQNMARAQSLAACRDRALEYCWETESLAEDKRAGLLYLSEEGDALTPSALLLTALCYRALADPPPVADGRMKSLGAFLCTMVAPDGKLYSSLEKAGERAGPFIGNGTLYAQTLTALDLLQKVSPTQSQREAATRLADLLASFPADVRIMADPRVMGHVAEALLVHYKLAQNKKYAEAVLKIAEALLPDQATAEKASVPDLVGGFAVGKLLPDTLTSASDASGLCAGYEASILLRRPEGRYSAPVQNAARFLMNMQYREENSYYLDRRKYLIGAFRRSPENLGLHLGATAESVRALLAAATVVPAETPAPANPAEKPAPH